MVIVVDASAVIAAADRREPKHRIAAAAFRRVTEPLVVPAPVTAEIDYLLDQRLGRESRLAFMGDVATGRLQVECLEREDYRTVLELEQRYATLNPGLADLSIVVIAARLRTTRLLTFDERHFRQIAPLQGGRFTLLPIDADPATA